MRLCVERISKRPALSRGGLLFSWVVGRLSVVGLGSGQGGLSLAVRSLEIRSTTYNRRLSIIPYVERISKRPALSRGGLLFSWVVCRLSVFGLGSGKGGSSLAVPSLEIRSTTYNRRPSITPCVERISKRPALSRGGLLFSWVVGRLSVVGVGSGQGGSSLAVRSLEIRSTTYNRRLSITPCVEIISKRPALSRGGLLFSWVGCRGLVFGLGSGPGG
jgi:predicted membrane protein